MKLIGILYPDWDLKKSVHVAAPDIFCLVSCVSTVAPVFDEKLVDKPVDPIHTIH
jgi:hypothetical protein